jgi:hypothetical protein
LIPTEGRRSLGGIPEFAAICRENPFIEDVAESRRISVSRCHLPSETNQDLTGSRRQYKVADVLQRVSDANQVLAGFNAGMRSHDGSSDLPSSFPRTLSYVGADFDGRLLIVSLSK